MLEKCKFIGKGLVFPKEMALAIGDLHLGYEEALRQRGLDVPLRQFKEFEEELKNLIELIKAKFGKIEKVIFLGDIKHHFNYQASEKEEINKLKNFLRKKGIEDEKIIFIRGNHEKNEKSEKFLDYYIIKDIIFLHGNKEFIEMYDKEINLVVMGHLHPTVTLRDKMKIKQEKYKCFLKGRYKKKDFIILPSFNKITEGVSANEFNDERAGGYDFSIIPQKELENFEVLICQNLDEALDFGVLRNI